MSSRVTDFGDRDGGVSPEDASGAAGRGWQDAAAARGHRQDAAPERHFGFWGRLVGWGAPRAGDSVMGRLVVITDVLVGPRLASVSFAYINGTARVEWVWGASQGKLTSPGSLLC